MLRHVHRMYMCLRSSRMHARMLLGQPPELPCHVYKAEHDHYGVFQTSTYLRKSRKKRPTCLRDVPRTQRKRRREASTTTGSSTLPTVFFGKLIELSGIHLPGQHLDRNVVLTDRSQYRQWLRKQRPLPVKQSPLVVKRLTRYIAVSQTLRPHMSLVLIRKQS